MTDRLPAHSRVGGESGKAGSRRRVAPAAVAEPRRAGAERDTDFFSPVAKYSTGLSGPAPKDGSVGKGRAGHMGKLCKHRDEKMN